MQSQLKRDWDGKDWEVFALRLVQTRHGAQNVQVIPDTVRGDAGIEFLTTDGCCYQCYAPAQSAETAKAASAMKAKATRDLAKLKQNATTVKSLLGTTKITRWILLCPFLDDKSVIAHTRARAEDLSVTSLSFVDADFHALVQSQTDFEKEMTTLRSHSLGISIDIQMPPPDQTSIHLQRVGTQMDSKLERGFPQWSSEQRNSRAQHYIRAHLASADTLEQLKNDFPDLWEMYRLALGAEEMRLQSVGSGSGDAAEQLNRELERLESSLSAALPSLDKTTITTMCTGTIATWLIECPLDFRSDGAP